MLHTNNHAPSCRAECASTILTSTIAEFARMYNRPVSDSMGRMIRKGVVHPLNRVWRAVCKGDEAMAHLG